METITERVDALVAGLGELTDEQLVHAAVARRIADFMDGPEAASYALAGLARELRNAIAALTGAPQAAGSVVLTDDDLDRLLRGA